MMNCPRCNKALTSQPIGSITGEVCHPCGGLWLLPLQLQTLLKNHSKDFSPALIQKTLSEAHAGIPKAKMDEKLACPACSSPMNALNYDYSSGIIVHICGRGDGIWFDKDELEEVEIFMDHWNAQETAAKGALGSKLNQARADVDQELDEEDLQVRKNLGPVSRMLDSIFHEFEKLSR